MINPDVTYTIASRVLSVQRRNPFPLYRILRRRRPVIHVPIVDLTLVSRYEDVQRVLTDHACFSSDFAGTLRPGHSSVDRKPILIAADPPIHTRLRGLVSTAFTPRAIAALEPRIEQVTHELLDAVVASGRIDVIRDLAYPLPVIVIADMLGIPPEDRVKFKRWSDEIVAWSDRAFFDPNALEAITYVDLPSRLTAEMEPYFQAIIARRRAEPGSDLISALIQAEIDGEHLSERDVLGFCWLLLIAGNVTTTNLIGNSVRTFLEHPEALAQIYANPDLLPSAIEEVLRYRSPIQSMFRVVKQDVTMGGQTLRPGQRVQALIGSANRDEAQFPEPDRFSIHRSPNRHLAFGKGIHYCLGAPLARLEANVALRIVLERLPTLARTDRRRLPATEGLLLYGVKSLPLRFQPPRRSLASAS